MKSNIKKLCSEKGMSIYQLAKDTGLTYEAVRRYERKGLNKAYFGCMVKIANALDCKLEDLYEEE